MSCFYRRTSKYHNTLQNDETGRTPLHNACINHAALSVIQQILNTDNYIRAKDSFGETPLHYACQFGASFSIVSLLLETCPEAVKDVGRYGWTPLHVAIRNKTASLEVIQLLMEKWPEAMRVEDENGCCPLHLACRNRASVDVVRLLVERCEEGVCRENHNGTLLHHACSFIYIYCFFLTPICFDSRIY
uniref:Uncharacterized protein n=1 Tax=Ditylum brightwellii TaxID=49249 RepID=A0A6V2BLJ0_9STRA